MNLLFVILLLLLSACASETVTEKPPAELRVIPANFSALPGWGGDDVAQAAPAFAKSCARMAKKPADAAVSRIKKAGTYGDWQAICSRFSAIDQTDRTALQTFFESHFQPYQVLAGSEEEGLFTGYYEAALRGSLARSGPFQTPLHIRPDDLVMVNLGEFREELKGQRIAGRVIEGNLKPYEPRADIVAGRWPHNDKVLVWVDDPVDAFFVQVQGSGVVEMDDGRVLRIGYAGQNGHPYYAIGRELVTRGQMTKEQVSLQTIRAWLEENPDQALEIMNTNKSYVFFKTLEGEGPLGGEGVALTPERSLAIDSSLLPYGVPVWVDIAAPLAGEPPLKRLMVAQDTGGAIRGPVRGDVFWGFGPRAEYLAGHMKSQGRYWVLFPRG
jgi:membrane-bound lytic murein transglycosylase A